MCNREYCNLYIFFFNDTATTEIYTLSLHDALPISYRVVDIAIGDLGNPAARKFDLEAWLPGQERFRELTSCSNTDRKSTRLNSSHANISYAVFCLKKKK